MKITYLAFIVLVSVIVSVLLLPNFNNPQVIGLDSIPDYLHNTNLLLAGQVVRPGDFLQLADFGQYFVTGNLMMTLPCNSAGIPLIVPIAGDIDVDEHHTYLTQIPLSIIKHASNNGTSCMYNATINAIDLVCDPDPDLDADTAYGTTCPSAITPIPPRVTTIGLLNTGENNVVFRTGNSMIFSLTSVVGDISQHLNHYGHPTNLPTHDPAYHSGSKTFEDLMGTSAIVVGSSGGAGGQSDSDNDGIPNGFDNCPNDFDPHNLANHSTLDTDDDGTTFGCDSDEHSLIDNLLVIITAEDPSVFNNDLGFANLLTHNGVADFSPDPDDSDGDGFLDDDETCDNKWDLLDKSSGMPLNVDGDGTTFSCESDDELNLFSP